MEKCRPAKAVAAAIGNLQLVGEQICEHAHALGVSTRRPVMDAERKREFDDSLHLPGLVRLATLVGSLQACLQVTLLAGSAGHREARRSLVGEGQREVEKSGQRQQLSSRSFQSHQGHQRRDDDDRGRQHACSDAIGTRQDVAQQRSDSKGPRDRSGEDREAKGTAQSRPSVPHSAPLCLGVAIAPLRRSQLGCHLHA